MHRILWRWCIHASSLMWLFGPRAHSSVITRFLCCAKNRAQWSLGHNPSPTSGILTGAIYLDAACMSKNLGSSVQCGKPGLGLELFVRAEGSGILATHTPLFHRWLPKPFIQRMGDNNVDGPFGALACSWKLEGESLVLWGIWRFTPWQKQALASLKRGAFFTSL